MYCISGIMSSGFTWKFCCIYILPIFSLFHVEHLFWFHQFLGVSIFCRFFGRIFLRSPRLASCSCYPHVFVVVALFFAFLFIHKFWISPTCPSAIYFCLSRFIRFLSASLYFVFVFVFAFLPTHVFLFAASACSLVLFYFLSPFVFFWYISTQ